MFLIVTRSGETRRIEIPLDVERAGNAEAWAATCAPDVWAAAELVHSSWPLPADATPVAAEPVVDAPTPDDHPLILDEE